MCECLNLSNKHTNNGLMVISSSFSQFQQVILLSTKFIKNKESQ